MTINLQMPDIRELRPRITIFCVGGAGGNAGNNMIAAGLQGVDFVVANTDAQALSLSRADRIIQMGVQVTEGLGAGSQPEVGRAAAEEVIDEIRDHLSGAHMVFITAGMGGGTGTGAAPVVARAAREMGILTVGVVTKPFHFEGQRRMRVAEAGIEELQKSVDTLIVIPNQNLFRVANERTTFADAFAMADQVLYSGVACITDLMVKEGLINLDFADVRSIMREMGKAMMGTGEATGDKRAIQAAEAAIANPLLDEVSMKGARGLLISISGGNDLTLYEVDEAATRIREEVDADANIILGATFDPSLEGTIRVSVVATGIDAVPLAQGEPTHAEQRIAELAHRLRPQPVARSFDGYDAQPQQRPLAPPRSYATPAAPAPVEQSYAHEAYAPEPVATFSQQDDVTIRPLPPKPVLFEEPASATQHHGYDHAEPAPFIPPAPERVALRSQRLPRIEDLPLPAQNQIRESRGEPVHHGHHETHSAEKKRMTLLQRLAAVGLGRREEEEEHVDHHDAHLEQEYDHYEQHEPAPLPQQQAPAADYGRRPAHQSSAPAYRPAQGSLDAHGRTAPQQRSFEDDQLEIPAFLRRQSS